MSVIGKLNNGVITVVAASEGHMVGYKKLIKSEVSEMRIDRITNQSYMNVQKRTPAIKPVSAVDVPDFMKQYSQEKRQQQQQQQSRPRKDVTPVYPPKVYSNLWNRIHDIRE
jgi:hypothetical protein